MAERSSQNKLQSLLTQIGSYRELIHVLQQQISNLVEARSELSMTLNFLKNMRQLKPDTEVLIPVGSGALVPGRLATVEKVLVEIGSGVVVEKSAEEAVQVIENRIKEVDETVGRLQKDIADIQEKIEAIRPEAEQLMKQLERES